MSTVLDELAPPLGHAAGSTGAAGHRRTAAIWWRVAPALVLCLPLLLTRVKLLLAPAPLADFVTYWASGRLFLHGADPYSASAVLAMERALGWSDPHVLMMLNPPWVLPFVALLGWLPFATAYYAWQVWRWRWRRCRRWRCGGTLAGKGGTSGWRSCFWQRFCQPPPPSTWGN
jgi:hypothetical protein